MFGEFQFGAGEFAGTQAIPIPTPVTPQTITRLKLECATVTCATEADTGVYSLQDTIPSRSVAAAECLSNECNGIDPDVQSYSLQDALYFNGTPVTVPVICPEGANCTPGSFPPTITFPPGEFVFPDVPVTPGQPITLQLQGCQSLVSVTLPGTATQAEINQAVSYIINQVALQQAQCITFPEFPFSTTVAIGNFVSSGCLNTFFSGSIAAAANPASNPLTFQIASGSLPTGVTLSSSSGTQANFSGTPTVAGSYTFTLRVIAANGAVAQKSFTVAIGGITTASLPDAVTGEPYSETLTSAGISGALLWGLAAGSLPPGLTLNPSTGVISGEATTSDVYPFSIFVQNASQQCVRAFSINVGTCIIATSSPLPEATNGEVYSTTLTATDITGTLVWSIIAGALPNGLSLNTASGEISGTPDTDGTYNFTAKVTSGDNTCQKAFELEVVPAEDCPDWTTMSWDDSGDYSISTFGGGAASFTPAGPGITDSFSATATSPGNPAFATASNTGRVPYNGAGCDCNLHLEIFSVNGTGALILSLIRSDIPSSNLLIVNMRTLGVGIHDIPFSLLDTGGLTATIEVIFSANANPTGGAEAMSWSAQITNVP